MLISRGLSELASEPAVPGKPIYGIENQEDELIKILSMSRTDPDLLDQELRFALEELSTKQRQRLIKQGFPVAKLEKSFSIERSRKSGTVNHFEFQMDKLKGENLDTVIKQMKKLDKPAIEKILLGIYQILHQMQFLANEQIIHRDIKPENIMVDEHNNWQLIDFGLSKHIDPKTLQIENKRGAYFGTVAYSSIEQINGKATLSSDLESLGLTIVEIFTKNDRNNFDDFDIYNKGLVKYADETLAKDLQEKIDQITGLTQDQKSALTSLAIQVEQFICYDPESSIQRKSIYEAIKDYEVEVLDMYFGENSYNKLSPEIIDNEHSALELIDLLNQHYPIYMHRRPEPGKLEDFHSDIKEKLEKGKKFNKAAINSQLDYKDLKLSLAELRALYAHKLEQSKIILEDQLFPSSADYGRSKEKKSFQEIVAQSSKELKKKINAIVKEYPSYLFIDENPLKKDESLKEKNLVNIFSDYDKEPYTDISKIEQADERVLEYRKRLIKEKLPDESWSKNILKNLEIIREKTKNLTLVSDLKAITKDLETQYIEWKKKRLLTSDEFDEKFQEAFYQAGEEIRDFIKSPSSNPKIEIYLSHIKSLVRRVTNSMRFSSFHKVLSSESRK